MACADRVTALNILRLRWFFSSIHQFIDMITTGRILKQGKKLYVSDKHLSFAPLASNFVISKEGLFPKAFVLSNVLDNSECR